MSTTQPTSQERRAAREAAAAARMRAAEERAYRRGEALRSGISSGLETVRGVFGSLAARFSPEIDAASRRGPALARRAQERLQDPEFRTAAAARNPRLTPDQIRARAATAAAPASAEARPRETAATTAPTRTRAASTSAATPTPTPSATTTAPTASNQQQPPELEASPRREPLTGNPIVADVRDSTIGTSITQVFDINSFRSELLQNDVLPAHSYLVTFSPFRAGYPQNTPLTSFVTNKRNTLMMRCENIVLPTPAFLEEENIRRYGYGPVEKVPYAVQFNDVTMTWIVDKDSEIIDFFHQWMNTVVMHDSPNTLMNAPAQRSGLNQYLPYEVGYKDAYTNPIVRVYVYNRQQQTVTEYEMYDVFPMNIQSMNLAWTEENQFQRLIITFAYINMKVSAPRKSSTPQYNFFEEGRISPYEERRQSTNRGGRAAADRADSPFNEVITTTVNASVPEAQAAIDFLADPSTIPAIPTSGPAEHDLT